MGNLINVASKIEMCLPYGVSFDKIHFAHIIDGK